MRDIERAIFPSILFGCVLIVGFTSLLANPKVVLASALTNNIETAAPFLQSTDVVDVFSSGGQNSTALDVFYETTIDNSSIVAGAAAEVVPAQAEQPPTIEQSAGCSLSPAVHGEVRQWCGLIERYATETGLDPDLLAALIYQESAGDPSAYSHSGAVGLMQVMPKDGLAAGFMCPNGPCFAGRPASAELYDPEYNIAYGSRLLAGLVQKYGSLREGLRAYGPSNSGYSYADLVLSIYATYR